LSNPHVPIRGTLKPSPILPRKTFQ
jgi:hypothetical protein